MAIPQPYGVTYCSINLQPSVLLSHVPKPKAGISRPLFNLNFRAFLCLYVL